MERIEFEGLEQGLDKFGSRKVQLVIKSNNITTVNTYEVFNHDVLYDPEIDGDCLILIDMESNQSISVPIEYIKEMNVSGEGNIYYTVIDLELNIETKISMCLDEKEIKCCKCGKVISGDRMTTKWKISTNSINYGSRFDNEGCNSREFDICDNCVAKTVGLVEV